MGEIGPSIKISDYHEHLTLLYIRVILIYLDFNEVSLQSMHIDV